MLTIGLSQVVISTNCNVDDILDNCRILLVVTKDDVDHFALVKKVGVLCRAFPTFMTYLHSFAFCNEGPRMVWDSNTQVYNESNANKKKRAMGFLTRTTSTYNLRKG